MNEPVLVSASPPATERRRLTLLVALGAVVALLLLVVPRFLSGGGGGGSDVGSAPAISTTTTTVPTAVEPAAVRSGTKDPFRPLVTPRAPDPAAPPVAAKAPGKSSLRLTDVYVDPSGKATAKVRLDGADLAVKDGQQFAGSYRVLNLDVAARCGNFLFGDQPFSLCAGEETSF
ncbi:MAG: hypothetical protein JWN67_223 [Actinomycetia bacterium]|nr:hypothetical protein [Actinomycetes bacterium]